MEKDKLSLSKKIILYFIGNFSTKIIGTILIPLYALYVKPFELGQVDLQQNIASILAPIMVLGVWEAILKFGLQSGNNKEKVLSTTFLYVIISCVIFSLILIPVYLLWYKNLFFALNYSLFITMTPIVSTLQYYTRIYNENVIFVKSSILSSLVRLLIILIFVVWIKLGVLGLTLSLVISQIIIIIYLAVGLNIKQKFSLELFDKKLLKKMLIFSFPLSINLVSIWFLSGFSRLFINYNYGNSANGIYAFAAQCSSLVAMLGQVVNMATLEDTLSSNKEDFEDKFRKQINTMTVVFFEFSILALPLISIFFIVISKTSFSNSYEYVPILILNAIVVSIGSNLNNAFQYRGETKFIFSTTLLAALTNIVLAFPLNNLLGIKGVVIAQLLGSLVLFLFRYILIIRKINFKIDFVSIFLLIFLFMFTSYLSSKLIMKVNIISFLLILLILVKKNFLLIKRIVIKMKTMISKIKLDK